MSSSSLQTSPRDRRPDGRLFLTEDYLDEGARQLLAAARRLQAKSRAALAAYTLNESHLEILFEIDLQKGVDISSLRDRLAGTIPTIARLLGELDKRGLIERVTDPMDGRRKRLYLTESGGILMKTLFDAMRAPILNAYKSAGEPAVSGALQLTGALLDEDEST